MRVIQQTVKVSKEDYHKFHLSIINPLFKDELRLSEKELEVLAAFMSLDKSITIGDMFNTYARKLVKEELGLSAGGLSNHLRSLIDKEFLSKDEVTNRITVKPHLFPMDGWQGYQFKIVLDEVK